MLPNTATLHHSGSSYHADPVSVLQAAGSLVGLGCEIVSNGGDDGQALAIFDAAYSIMAAPTWCSADELWSIVAKHLQIERSLSNNTKDQMPPDLYQEGECDVGPRVLRTPVVADFYSTYRRRILESIILFNKGLICFSKGAVLEAKQYFDVVAFNAQEIIQCTTGIPSISFLEMTMRTFNNLGLIEYLEKKEGLSMASFETAIHFGRQLTQLNSNYCTEYATTLSNWCRASWMRGDTSPNLYKYLQDILRIRVQALSWDHPDVAAARFNIAVAEYARQDSDEAASQLRQYLAIVSHRSKIHQLSDLDAIPALVFLLLIENEEKEDKMSQELVRGLRALQDKRQDEGSDSPELAAVLNFVGALLFHVKAFDHALVFFSEELRLEEKYSSTSDGSDEATSVRVTCNNIGRILQELGRYHDAMHYYERALKADFGSIKDATPAALKATSTQIIAKCCKSGTVREASANPFSSVNLYSTVWYNLGLIKDKLGVCGEAILAFEISHGLREAMLGPDHPDVACLLYNIGVLQMETNRLGEASMSFRKALRIRHVGSTGPLNDRHIIKTLERLASLHEAKTNFSLAIEAQRSVLAIQQMSQEFDEDRRRLAMGITLRSISDLFEAEGNLSSALKAATESVDKLRMVVGSDMFIVSDGLLAGRLSVLEHFVSSLLSLGILYHETCDPVKAESILREAARITTDTGQISTCPASLRALQGVSNMLATCLCAPKA
jgi:tetratricopeptide (TPR) repeat protein